MERFVNRTLILTYLSFLLLFSTMTSVALLQPCVATNDYTYTYSLTKTDGSEYTLTLTISSLLYQFYSSKGRAGSDNEFVTPLIFSQVATQIRSVFTGDEDFANAVLMITHQIPQPQGNVPLKYPVETIVDNIGDCDVFSVLAASIMKAGGLDVTLLSYSPLAGESYGHMNVGVYLPYEPSSRTGIVSWFPYNGRNYYFAETTGGVQDGGVSTPWRVGESNGDYSSGTIISLTNYDTSSPSQVGASLVLVTQPSPSQSHTPSPSPVTAPSFSFAPIEYGLVAVSCVGVAGFFLFRFMSRGTKQREEEQYPVSGGISTQPAGKLPFDSWCICPKCGAYISAKIEYCPCGAKLPDKYEASLSIQNAARNEPIIPRTTAKLPEGYWCACPGCGAYIGIDKRYCPFCQAKLPYWQHQNR